MPNNAHRFNTDTATSYRIREAALRQGRSVADVIRRAVEQYVDAYAPNAVDGDYIATDEGERRNGAGKMTGCYLSGPLAAVVMRMSKDEGRTQSAIVRSLLREALHAHDLLSGAVADATTADATTD